MSLIGKPISRPEGPQKVRGLVTYAADYNEPGQLHAITVGAPHAAGKIERIDATRALAMPGVVRVLTRADMPRFGKLQSPPAAVSRLPMQDDEVWHEGQPVAIVLAETLEQAEAAAGAVTVQMAVAKPVAPRGRAAPEGDAAAANGLKPERGGYVSENIAFSKGDTDAAMAAASRRVAKIYTQPSRHNNPMEPSATLAVWDGTNLTLYDAVQHGYSHALIVATALGLKPETVRVICPHTGGGFGAKGYVWPHEILAAAAARIVGRPVKLVLTRAQMYAQVGYQPRIVHDMALAADESGRLTGVRHIATNVTAQSDDFVEMATAAAKMLYATPAIKLEQRVERINTTMPTAMRAPVEGPGTWALESAMDELAHALNVDPLDLRLINHADVHPADGKPWSSKKLREAYEAGAKLYRWRERATMPKTDGHWQIGHGMASCAMGTFRFPAVARVRLKADDTAVVETGTHDIGSGTTTIFPQIAAEALGLPMERVSITWGNTGLPPAGPTYGSSSTMGVGAAVMQAAADARAKLARLTNARPETLDIQGAMRRAGVEEIVGNGSFVLPGEAQFEEGGHGTPYAMATFGAIFVEVGVDPELGLIRLRRAVGSYSAGRIINAKTARSQMTGGIIWGWGKAALEQSIHEPHYARFLSKNLSGVAIPVNADIPSNIIIHFVDEVDEHASPVGGKGIGELGATGVAAAVANAVFDAIGIRVREVPITPEKLLAA